MAFRTIQTFLRQNIPSNQPLKINLSIKRSTIRMSSSVADDVIAEEKGNVGVITLNRPKALNALNLSMVQKVNEALQKWEKQKDVIIVKGSIPRSFCAGGDVKTIVEAARQGNPSVGEIFFKNEYNMNLKIGMMETPYVALINGIVMGGGVGLSVHGRYRVATETTLFAMPETLIGLFPDVGASYFLPKLSGFLGLFLGLTGYRLKGYDVVHAGIATHFCDSSKIDELERRLVGCKNAREIDAVLKDYKPIEEPRFSLLKHKEQIDKFFSLASVEDIVESLKRDDSQWARETLDVLSKMSPTSLKLAFKLYKNGAGKSLEYCLNMEYNAACQAVRSNDFSEGVRALLIDKDQNPKWNPNTLEEVDDNIVNQFFQFKQKL